MPLLRTLNAHITELIALIILLVVLFFTSDSLITLNWVWWVAYSAIVLIAWLLALIVGGDKLVDWAENVSVYYWLPPLIVGMTILAMGTSMPELFVNIIAAFRGETGLLVANVVWSNISNLMLIVWVTALIAAIPVKRMTIRTDITISIAAAWMVLVMISDWAISTIDGLILLVTFWTFLAYLIKRAKIGEPYDDTLEPVKKHEMLQGLWYIALWIVALYVWGDALVTWAVSIASSLWVSTLLIWASIVAIWTSVPELVTSMIAARKGQTDMAMGNIVWSNIFNLLWIIWVTALVKPIAVQDLSVRIDVLYLIGVSILLAVFLAVQKWTTAKNISKRWGLICILAYAAYLWFLLYRG